MPPFTRRAKQPRTDSTRNPSSLSLASSSRSAVFLEEIIIPDDVLIEILKRIPLKALVQFTCVCKSWLDLLSSPTFTSVFAIFNSSSFNSDNEKKDCMHLFKEPLNIHSEEEEGVNFSIYNATNFESLSLIKPEKIVTPLKIGIKDFVVCSGDGVLCFFDLNCADPVFEPMMLWNPSIQKGITVNAPTYGVVDFTSNGFPKLIFGFGYDPVMNDHVLVRVRYFCGGSYFCGGEYGTTILMADVYGVNLESWKRVPSTSVLRDFMTIRWRGVCVNRVIHWVGNLNVRDDEKDRVCKSILTFKLGSNVFGVIDLPKDVVDVRYEFVRLVSVRKDDKDVLGVIHNTLNVFSLWVMMTNGVSNNWIKCFSIDLGFKIVNDLNHVAVLNDKVVLVKRVFGELKDWICYDCGSLVEQRIRAVSVLVDYVDRYVESLVLLGQQNGVLPWRPPPPPPPPAQNNLGIYRARYRRALRATTNWPH